MKEQVCAFSPEEGDYMIVGKSYTFVGENGKYGLKSGNDYRFLGVIKCLCSQGCRGYKGLFEGMKHDYWNFPDGTTSGRLRGASLGDFLNEGQMNDVFKILE